jgi:hypothetical protein
VNKPLIRLTRYPALLLILVALTVTAAIAQSPTPRRPAITLVQLEDMFQNMREKTKWNVDGDLLWGYFFTDPQPDKLRPLADELTKLGYRYVDLYAARDGKTHVLHVEKGETHTPRSLHERNTEFYRLAERHGIASYDGMDVGPAPGKP